MNKNLPQWNEIIISDFIVPEDSDSADLTMVEHSEASSKVIYHKYFKDSEESCSCSFLGRLGRLKISTVFLLGSVFLSYFQGQNKCKIRVPAHFRRSF